jgi:DNA-binding XRE family transcriptional regulator
MAAKTRTKTRPKSRGGSRERWEQDRAAALRTAHGPTPPPEAERRWNLELAMSLPWDDRFAVRLRALRARSGLSQKQLAREIGATQTRVSRWESGTGNPSIRALVRLCRALDADLAILCDPDAGLPTTPYDPHARLRKACAAAPD